jgi:cytochrome c oxidase assembly protein subunit 15
LIVPLDEAKAESLDHDFTDRPIEHGKAWKEMTHRYAAGILGLLTLALAIMAWVNRSTPGQQVWFPTIILLLVIFQALLGMWTVTLLLKPVIVMGHLLGGMTILCLLLWLLLRQSRHTETTTEENKLRSWIIASLVIVVIQVSLGGWTSSNYAALACPDFPTCQGTWWPKMDFNEGFKLWRGLGVDYEGGILSGEARTAIHMSHRLGAILVLIVVGAVAIRAILDKNRSIARTGKVLIAVLFLQIGLGISNVVKSLPLPIAVAHNAMAALLLLCLVTLIHYAVPLKYKTGEPLG